MKLKSAAGMVCYVQDLDQTIPFYEKLGFQFKTKEPTRATAYLNWWWVDFHQAGAADDAPAWHMPPDMDNAKSGSLFYFSVENVNKAYEEVTASGLRPASEPVTLRGNKEFMLVDPDGNRLVFFARK